LSYKKTSLIWRFQILTRR